MGISKYAFENKMSKDNDTILIDINPKLINDDMEITADELKKAANVALYNFIGDTITEAIPIIIKKKQLEEAKKNTTKQDTEEKEKTAMDKDTFNKLMIGGGIGLAGGLLLGKIRADKMLKQYATTFNQAHKPLQEAGENITKYILELHKLNDIEFDKMFKPLLDSKKVTPQEYNDIKQIVTNIVNNINSAKSAFLVKSEDKAKIKQVIENELDEKLFNNPKYTYLTQEVKDFIKQQIEKSFK